MELADDVAVVVVVGLELVDDRAAQHPAGTKT